MKTAPNLNVKPNTQAALRAALGPGFQVATADAMFRLVAQGPARR